MLARTITLRMARELNGYTVEDVAERFGVSTGCLNAIEDNSSLMTVKIAKKVIDLYGIPLGVIFVGTEAEYAMRIRSSHKHRYSRLEIVNNN